jgi:hypothetical protein
VSGLIVAVTGKTLQVRTTSGQSGVTYTGKTAISESRQASAAALKAGLCAVVRGAAGGASASAGTTVTAESVSLSAPTGGTCQAAGFGGGQRPGRRPSGAPTAGPLTPPSAAPSVGPNGRRFGGQAAFGKITSVSGNTMVVAASQPGSTGTVPTPVTLTAATMYTIQAKASPKAVTRGKCVFATGSADKTGATTATALRLGAAANGSCTTAGPRQADPSGGQTGG